MKDINGNRNGRLVAISPLDERSPGGHVIWLCQCDCGNQTKASTHVFGKGSEGRRSCGCLVKEANAKKKQNKSPPNSGSKYSLKGMDGVYSNKQSWSKAAISHYGNECQRCGWNQARCDVHHKIPKSKGGKNTLNNAEVICPNCHRIEHERDYE